VISPELAALVEANAWTFGPVATAVQVLRLTLARGADPAEFWPSLLHHCPRMTPLAYWLNVWRAGMPLADLEGDLVRREEQLARNLEARLSASCRVLVVGHDRELDRLWELASHPWQWRYLLVEGPLGAPAPGCHTRRADREPWLGPPFVFQELELGLEWADTVVLAGVLMHRQNILGPGQLRPLLASAREQVEQVVMCMLAERRHTLGEGAPRRYTEDFRPYYWQASVTHVVSEWQAGAPGAGLGWLPLPPSELASALDEDLFNR
jgi:hypothetical protein